MSNNLENSRRLAKNTIVLYIRTIVTLFISLYTSRIILEVLGVEDYGIYNIVGGFVAMFGIISQTMIAATQRYLTFELEKVQDNHSSEFFSSALIIHIALAAILFLLLETLGLWFLNFKLNIDSTRMEAANWIFHFSVITFLLSIIRAPFEASVIAHEKMTAFAFINVFEAFSKLAILYIILAFNYDKLIQYGFFTLLITIVLFILYFVYCRVKFSEIKFRFVKDKHYYSEMFSFAGYNFIGSCSSILANQGLNIILNIFYGVAVNAARGIAMQVGTAISKFVGDFSTALNPQITKSYAKGDIDYTMSLVYKGSKLSFFLYFLFSLPIIVDTPFILDLWLGKTPDYAILFVRWTLVTSLLNTFANPLTTCAFATGNIKKLSLWLGAVRFMVLPFTYIAFKLGLSPVYAYVIAFGTDLLLLFIRLNIVCILIGISRIQFFNEVLRKAIIVVSITFVAVLGIDSVFCVSNFIGLLFKVSLICVMTSVVILFLGLTSYERKYVVNIAKSKILRR